MVPVILPLVPKSADADELNDNLQPVYAVATVLGAEEALSTVSMMATELDGDAAAGPVAAARPDAGAARQSLGENFPALGRCGVFVETFNNNLDNYDTLRPVKVTPITWTVILGGVVVLLAGLAMAWWERQERREPEAPKPVEREQVTARAP